MNRRISWKVAGGLWTLLGVAWLAGQGATPVEAPHIVHDPVGVALRGQPITVLAQISSVTPIKAVTLHYTLSRDASPFKLAMQSAGPAIFTGTIPATLLGNAGKVSYYIEATDARDAAAETPWYTVQIKGAGDALAAPTAITTPAPAMGATADTNSTSYVGAALIAGGALAVVGAGLYVASRSSSSSDGGGGGGATTNVQGTYTGSKTISLARPGQATSSATTPVTIIIDQNGGVFSDSLIDGRVISGSLSGSSFALSGSTSSSNLVSNYSFTGSVVDNRIVGTVSGSAQSATTSGTYSGSFSAGK